MGGAGDWSTDEVADLLEAVADCDSEGAAIDRAVERIGRAVDAQGSIYVRDGQILGSWGLSFDHVTGATPDGAQIHTAMIAVVGELGGHFVLARELREFEPHERALVRSMGGALSMSLSKIQSVRAEEERWNLLTRLSLLQRQLSHHAPIQDVLDAVSQASRELLGEDIGGVLLESEEDGTHVLHSLVGADLNGHRGARIHPELADRAIASSSPTVVDNLAEEPHHFPALADLGAEVVILVPVREAGGGRGLLLVASQTPARRFSEPEHEALTAFAEHASLVLTDARLTDQIDRALHDSLTGLANRALLTERLAERIEAGFPSPALLTLDLDSFRDINDRIGHRAGDALLIELAQRLTTAAGEEALVARLDGDAFAVLSHAEGAPELGGRLLAVISDPFEIEGRVLRTTASIGLVHSGSNPDQFLREADLAMHRAKDAGGGRLITFEPRMHEELVRRIQLQDDLARALDAGEIVAYFQPKVDLRTAGPIGVEALVRWDHPRRGLLSPGEFLELADAGGHMRALTERVIEFSTRVAGDWWHSGLGLQLSVNLAGSIFSDPGYRIDGFVKRALDRAGLPGNAIQFEVTEDALMADPETASEMLERLSRLGATISIDDFGTGHSSLSRLKSLPIDELKIDRSFIVNLRDEKDKTIVRSTIHLAHQMGLQVVGEGVETEEAWRLLRSMGCERAQGFLIAKPLPARDVPAWLATWNQRARELSATRRAEIAAAPI
jgi:diguanylate cyclase (GGDEF)-like protein